MQGTSVRLPTPSGGNHAFRKRGARVRITNCSTKDNSARQIQLPGGAYWWLGADNSTSVIYGESWTLQRPGRRGGPGLVKQDPAKLQPYRAAQPSTPSGPPAITSPTVLGVTPLGCVVVIDTEYTIIVDPVDGDSNRRMLKAPETNTACAGLVYVGSAEDELVTQPQLSINKHPRRTQRIKFSCNLCGTVTHKSLNPHAWQRGSVFARCDGCKCVHKLKDNLKVRVFRGIRRLLHIQSIPSVGGACSHYLFVHDHHHSNDLPPYPAQPMQIFHELSGPVFPPRDMRRSFPAVRDALDRIEEQRRRDWGG